MAKVTVQQVPEGDGVLLWEGRIEPVVLVERSHRLGIAHRLLAEVGRSRIAWHDVRQHEYHHRDPDGQENERHEALAEETQKRLGRPLARSPQPETDAP